MGVLIFLSIPVCFVLLAMFFYKSNTVLGFQVIELLESTDAFVSGREIVKELKSHGVRVDYANFYLLCKELEEARCVTCIDRKVEKFNERLIKLRPGAQLRWKFSRLF